MLTSKASPVTHVWLWAKSLTSRIYISIMVSVMTEWRGIGSPGRHQKDFIILRVIRRHRKSLATNGSEILGSFSGTQFIEGSTCACTRFSQYLVQRRRDIWVLELSTLKILWKSWLLETNVNHKRKWNILEAFLRYGFPQTKASELATNREFPTKMSPDLNPNYSEIKWMTWRGLLLLVGSPF